MAMSAAVFSATSRVAVLVGKAGASFTLVTLMITAMEALSLGASESSVAVTVTM